MMHGDPYITLVGRMIRLAIIEGHPQYPGEICDGTVRLELTAKEAKLERQKEAREAAIMFLTKNGRPTRASEDLQRLWSLPYPEFKKEIAAGDEDDQGKRLRARAKAKGAR